MARKTDEQRRHLRRGRRDAPTAPAQVQGFLNPGGQPRAVTGDDDAPNVHVPPFPTPVERLVEDTAVKFDDQHPYAVSKEIDVEWARVLTLFVYFNVITNEAPTKLSLIPEAFDERLIVQGFDFWFPLAVIGSTISPVEPPVGGGSRDLFASELRSPALTVGKIYRVALSLDVAPFRKARVQYAAIASQQTSNELIIDITTSQ